MTGSTGDVIKIEGMRLFCTLGMHEWERHVNREVIVDIALHTDISRPAASDRIADAVNYSEVVRRVSAYVTGSEFNLIEALVDGVAAECLSLPNVDSVDVRVEKVGASSVAGRVAVEITRSNRR